MNACWAAFVYLQARPESHSPRRPWRERGPRSLSISLSPLSVCDAIRGWGCGGCECDTIRLYFLSIFIFCLLSAGLVLARRTSFVEPPQLPLTNIQRDSDPPRIRPLPLFW